MIGALFSFLVGAALALRFRVWALLPVSFVAVIVSLTYGIIQQDAVLVLLGRVVGVVVVLQLGYCFGLLSRHVMLLSRIRRLPRPATEDEQAAIQRLESASH